MKLCFLKNGFDIPSIMIPGKKAKSAMRDGDIREMLGGADANEMRYREMEMRRNKEMNQQMDEMSAYYQQYEYEQGYEIRKLRRKPASIDDLLPFFDVDYSLLK